MTENAQPLIIEDDGPVRILRLNRPDVLNALDDTTLDQLRSATRKAAKDDSVRCLLITATGRAFSAGQDLDSVKKQMADPGAPELGQHLRKRYNPIILALRTMEKPVIAAVNGVAAGAGCSLALACDLRIAAQSASFIEAFINVGLVPDSGSTFMLPRLVGLARALELAITGKKITAADALTIGLVNEVVPDEQLEETALTRAKQLAALPTKAITLTKRAINRAWTADLPDQLDYEAHLQTIAGQTRDHREGLTAFLEKRNPTFTGR